MIVAATIADVDAKKGNNGQCRQVQKLLPPELRDYPGCHDTFTGPGHNTPATAITLNRKRIKNKTCSNVTETFPFFFLST